MNEDFQNLKKYIWISLIIFIALFFVRFIFAKIPFNYGYGQVNLGTLLLLFFGIYLIFVSSLYFRNIFFSWKNGDFWKKDIIKAYLLLLLFGVFLSLLMYSGGGPIKFFTDFPGLVADIDIVGIVLLITSLSIVFPTSIYTFLLSIKSFLISRQEKRSYYFGITLLILSLIWLVASIGPFFQIVMFWIRGGFLL